MHGEPEPLRQQSTLLKASGHCKIITPSQWWCVLMSNTAVKILLRCWVPKRNGVSPLWRFTVCTRHLFSIHTRNPFFYSSMNNISQVKPWKIIALLYQYLKKERLLHTGCVMNEWMFWCEMFGSQDFTSTQDMDLWQKPGKTDEYKEIWQNTLTFGLFSVKEREFDLLIEESWPIPDVF